jgi:hypothetical protein
MPSEMSFGASGRTRAARASTSGARLPSGRPAAASAADSASSVSSGFFLGCFLVAFRRTAAV